MSIQEKMFKEIKDNKLFSLANEFGFKYLREVSDRNVYPIKTALVNLAEFDEPLLACPIGAEEILVQLNRFGGPASVAQVGGRYFGFVNGNMVPAGLVTRLLSDYWNQNTAMKVMSPISAKLETVVQRWLIQLFGLPKECVAGFVSGTSMATFCGLAAARYRILKNMSWDINESGLFNAPHIRVVVGRQAHSTVLKAISLLGFGKNNIEWVDTDNQGRILVDKLPVLDEKTIVILQAGNVNTGSFDYFSTICEKANKSKSWIHIDGAFGLWAATVDKLRYLVDGIEKADSWSVDAHKTLNTPYDNGIILCKDSEALTASLHMTGSYIVVDEERDGMFFTPEMSRRSRIIELWATLKSLGKNGIDEMIYTMHERAKQFKNELENADFLVLNEVVFNQVAVHYKSNEFTKELLKEVQDLSVCWCGGSKWQDKDIIRISVCSWATTEEDVKKSTKSFILARENVKKKLLTTSST
jgi:glutamate/tyrosine decarboxylase-like PLP-dependent enzyme